jgi:D-alanyl-D-alanine carboxypeptidase (penicillin-binding protein 5/6)
MIRRTAKQITFPLTILLALLCIAASKPKSPQVRRALPATDDDQVAVAYQTRELDSDVIPRTRAASVIVEDARTGDVLYEKNADAPRAAASTQKLLTALIVSEEGFLDRQVTVQTVDTLAEPVRLNIKPGETYQRIDLLRALLVKSPNDVARCLARDNAGSIELFAEKMNAKARAMGATHSNFVNPNGLPIPDQ